MIVHFLQWFACLWSLICLFVFTLMIASLLTRRCNMLFHRRGQVQAAEESPFRNFLAFVMMPLSFLALLFLSVVYTPYFWLYPERHATRVDFHGTEMEQQALANYRALLARKPFWRRLAEKLRLVQTIDPPGPGLNRGTT